MAKDIEQLTISELQEYKIRDLKQAYKNIKERLTDEYKIKRCEIIVNEIIDFIKWLPEHEAYKQILVEQWKGYTIKQIAKRYGTTGKKLNKIIKERHRELMALYLEELRQEK